MRTFVFLCNLDLMTNQTWPMYPVLLAPHMLLAPSRPEPMDAQPMNAMAVEKQVMAIMHGAPQ